MSDCSGWLQAGRHCGTISVTLDWPDTGTIPARATRPRHPRARLRHHLADEAKVRLHRLGTRTADFHVCTVRGAIPS